jgi:hypothetical protein
LAGKSLGNAEPVLNLLANVPVLILGVPQRRFLLAPCWLHLLAKLCAYDAHEDDGRRLLPLHLGHGQGGALLESVT